MIPRVGMKVKIVKYLPEWRGGFTSFMREQVGRNKIWTIGIIYKGPLPRVKLREDLELYDWPPECMVEVRDPISLRNVSLRGDKGEVSRVKKRKSVEKRPISARVAIAGHTLALTYHEDGRFYYGIDSPIDLVNK